MQALPSIPRVAPSLPESKSTQAKGDSRTNPEGPSLEPGSSPFELDTSNIIPVSLPGPGPQKASTPVWVQPVMHWNGHIVIDRHGPSLCTDRCCECNAKADRTVQKRYPFQHRAIMGHVLRKIFRRLRGLSSEAPAGLHASVDFGMCDRCAHRRSVRFALGLAGLISSVSFLVQALISGGILGALWIAIGLGLLVAGAKATIAGTCIGKPARIDNRWIILKGGGEEFRASLEQSPLAQL